MKPVKRWPFGKQTMSMDQQYLMRNTFWRRKNNFLKRCIVIDILEVGLKETLPDTPILSHEDKELIGGPLTYI